MTSVEYKPSPKYVVSLWFRKILVPVDGSGLSMKAINLAIDFAHRYGSKITALFVLPESSASEKVDNIKRKIISISKDSGIEIDFKCRRIHFPESSIAKEIIDEINEGLYDAVIMGAKGLSGGEEAPIGSVATAVAILAPCTVILVR